MSEYSAEMCGFLKGPETGVSLYFTAFVTFSVYEIHITILRGAEVLWSNAQHVAKMFTALFVLVVFSNRQYRTN